MLATYERIYLTFNAWQLTEGIKDKMAAKLYGNMKSQIHEKSDLKSLAGIMAGSNIFQRGLGERKIMALFKVYPNILTSDEDYEMKIDMITENVEGFAKRQRFNDPLESSFDEFPGNFTAKEIVDSSEENKTDDKSKGKAHVHKTDKKRAKTPQPRQSKEGITNSEGN